MRGARPERSPTRGGMQQGVKRKTGAGPRSGVIRGFEMYNTEKGRDDALIRNVYFQTFRFRPR